MSSSSSIPRSQTGLVPISHHIRMDRKASPNNYRKLPPRPPPETYPYRGGGKSSSSSSISINRTKMKKNHNYHPKNQKQKSKGIKKTKTNVIFISKKIDENFQHNHDQQPELEQKQQQQKGYSKPWEDIFISEKEVYQLTKREKEERQKCQYESLKYLRESARHRRQLDALERRLDLETGISLGSTVSSRTCSNVKNIIAVKKSNDSRRGGCHLEQSKEISISSDDFSSSSFLEDLSNFKASMLNICVSNCNHNDISEPSSTEEPYLDNDIATSVSLKMDGAGDEKNTHSTHGNKDLEEGCFDQRTSKSLNTLTSYDYLSTQSNDTSQLDSIYSRQIYEKSSLSRNVSSFSHDDVSFLPSDDTSSLNVKPIMIGSQQDGNKDIHFLQEESTSISNNSFLLDERSVPSNKTLWDELSDDQMQRIRRKMKECFSQHPIQIPLDVPLISNIRSNSIEGNNNFEINDPHNASIKNEKKKVTCIEEVGSPKETILQDQLPCGSTSTTAKTNTTKKVKSSQEGVSQDYSYLSNIISQISEGLYTSIHTVAHSTQEQNQLSEDFTKKTSESSLLNDCIPRPISQPVHPFTLPLAADIKDTIKRGKP